LRWRYHSPRLYHGYTSAIMTELADGRLGELTYCRVRPSRRGYRAYADAIQVTAVADVVDETARRRAPELGAAAYTDFRQMILEEPLDAVDICLPHHLHAEAIVSAAQVGKAHLVREAALSHCPAGERGTAGGQCSKVCL
jgi:hypothetical protein